MKKTLTLIIIALAAAFFTACAEPAANTAPANNGPAKPVAAAPTKEALLDLDKKANEAWFKGDTKFFEGFLSDKFVSFDNGQRMTKAEVLKMMGTMKCDVKTWTLDDAQMSKINADTYVLSAKGTYDGSCTGADGKSMKIPSPMRTASIYARNGDKWEGVYHAETPILGGDADVAMADANKKAEPMKDAKKDDVAKATEPKKDEAKKDAMADKSTDNADDKMAAKSETADGKPNDAKPAAPVADANTEALVKLHQAGWDAWKAKDAKKFEEMLTTDFAFVAPNGMYIGSKAEAIKTWTETMKCEGVNNVKVTDGFASAISSTVELLTLTGTADGTCDGQKNGPLYQSAVYVKEGDAWKLAFLFESPKI